MARVRIQRTSTRSLFLAARSAFTLLEIVLALAILAVSLAALGEVMRVSDLSASRANEETQAQILAESLMAELESGARPMTAVDRALFDSAESPRWEYSIAFENTNYDELMLLRVFVVQEMPPELEPARFEIVRWVINPDAMPVSAAQQQSTGTESTSGTSESGDSTSAFGAGGTP